MRLYLVQHGDAVPEQKNPARPLSDRGRRDVQRMASFLARGGVKAARVIHSGKERARDTAVLLAEVLGPGRAVEEAESGLAPNDPTDPLFDALPRLSEDVMVVGHMPYMGRLAARLLTGSEAGLGAAFAPGSVVCLERDDAGAWSLVWMVRPELLGS
jgi:phosphohistidine phosphatase